MSGSSKLKQQIVAIESEHGADHDEASEMYSRSVGILERTDGPNSPVVANVLSNLAELHIERADYSAADAALTRSLGIVESIVQSPEPSFESDVLGAIAQIHRNLLAATVNLRRKQGDYAQAEALQKQILERVLGAGHHRTNEVAEALAAPHSQMGEHANEDDTA